MIEEDLDFFELIILFRISQKKENSYLEKLSPELSTSFFEVANRVGALKLKGLIDLKPGLGMNEIVLTDKSKKILEQVEKKSSEHLDLVDKELLKVISQGFSELNSLKEKLNIRDTDLAVHIHRLCVQHYLDYKPGNNTVTLTLTESGFIKAHSERKTVQKHQEKQEAQKSETEEKANEDVEEILREKPEKTEGEKRQDEKEARGPEGIKTYESKTHYLLEKHFWKVIILLILTIITVLVLLLQNK